ncbi:HrpB1 family type III secretion system apparatus protein [Burkholderia sp. Z1]|uniref:HrpB1 family type III secretion system apparatus protein n=1 Tax=Burkholderia sp. Z1 TaxID=2759039 RepID=UPI0018662E2B|nr:HrpB1 family type III secretion system apparatus protein [Burkholderia sp. Z1]
MQPDDDDDVAQLGRAVIDSIMGDRFDEAEGLLERLCVARPAARSLLIFPVAIAIRRGRPQDALHLVNGLHEDERPDLKALCLHALGDPLWHSYAVEHQDSPDPDTRKVMRGLLGIERQGHDFEAAR